MTKSPSDRIEDALKQGIQAHFASKRQEVDGFIQRHYRYPGCWQVNKHAFGLDLVRAPLNLLWAPIYITLILSLLLLGLAGVKTAPKLAKRLPGGMTTSVQRHLNAKLQRELLNTEDLRTSIVEAVESLPAHRLASSKEQHAFHQQLDDIIEESLKQLMLTRTASADITNTLFSTALGALAFNKFTPGGFGLGIILAALWVRHRAEQKFFLGDTMGSWYYTLFPPKPEPIETAVGVLLVMILLSIVASFSGLVTDPVQARIGLHKKRLTKMLNQMEKDLLDKANNRFKPLDPYVARILELFDTFKSQFSL